MSAVNRFKFFLLFYAIEPVKKAEKNLIFFASVACNGKV